MNVFGFREAEGITYGYVIEFEVRTILEIVVREYTLTINSSVVSQALNVLHEDVETLRLLWTIRPAFYVEDIVANIKPISQLLLEYDEPADIVNALFDDYNELGTQQLRFKCECNKGRFARILRKLPASDLQEMIDEDNGCEVVCRFCGTKYQFSRETLQGFIDSKK